MATRASARGPRRCCATPTPRCTAPRSAAAASTRSSTTTCAPRAVRRLEIENALHRALERGEFLLHYQPQVVAGDRRGRGRRGAGALAAPGARARAARRVHRVGRGDRPDPRDRRVGPARGVRAGGALGASRRATGPPLRMSVNLSARQCAHPDLVGDGGARRCAETGGDPATICLEITETAVMADMEAGGRRPRPAARRSASRWPSTTSGPAGRRCGRSQRFPVDEVKIDKQLRRRRRRATRRRRRSSPPSSACRTRWGCGPSPRASRRVAQVDRLRALGCDIAQGYFFWRPAPAADLTTAVVRISPKRAGTSQACVTLWPFRRSW